MSTTSWRPRPTTPPERLNWALKDLQRDLATILAWARQRAMPAVYSCNHDDIWPTVGLGHSSAWERNLRTGQNRLLDAIHRSALRSRPQGGRIDIMADGAYWTESGRQFLAWTYVDPTRLTTPTKAPPVDVQEIVRRAMAEAQARIERPRPTPPASAAIDPEADVVLIVTSHITSEVEEFIVRQTEAYYDDCLANDDYNDPPERFLTWREFLWEYIDGEELDDGRLVRLTGDDTAASRHIRERAKDHWRSLT